MAKGNEPLAVLHFKKRNETNGSQLPIANPHPTPPILVDIIGNCLDLSLLKNGVITVGKSSFRARSIQKKFKGSYLQI